MTVIPNASYAGQTFSYAMIGSSQTPATNRLSSVLTYDHGQATSATTNFTYDNAGNMTQAGTTTYEWDAANRLKSVNSGALGSYGYDGNGKRVKKTEGGATTYYVYSSVLGSAVMEVAAAGVQRAYVMNGNSVVAQLNPNGNFYWLHVDHLGSGRKMTDASGAVVYRAEYEPYGKLTYEWSSTSNLNTKKFTGYERDAATGLDYAQARMYASEWGRFMSPDPAGLGAASLRSPKTLNRYSYVNGNPVNFVDPSGLEPEYTFCSWWDYPFTGVGAKLFEGAWGCSTYSGKVVSSSGGGESRSGSGSRKTNNLPRCLLDFLGQYKELKGVDIEKVMMFPNSLPSADITGIHAITIGNNVFFAGGKYNLTYNGMALIAHELFHVKQYQDAGGVGKFLKSYFSEFRANLEKRVGPIDDFPTIPSLGGDGLDEAYPFLMKLGVVLGRLNKNDVHAAYADISYEKDARKFQDKVRIDLEANGSPCIP